MDLKKNIAMATITGVRNAGYLAGGARAFESQGLLVVFLTLGRKAALMLTKNSGQESPVNREVSAPWRY